ncbi:hypothetical protein RHMOL_Rhmol04G0245900 [Rhododendron molle]|uniref:Uncharacterized protein n=2 Tax=Rhododendron molle TaxID=49168 RepID=A0ACC0P592_RHOML|nr:hypothetical protein RHMOL_Rhmol04G0245900 [Rhododendron molle]KAI8560314.1 hypothetical protein RHMOL_Rhmol04G0245900 [Rhododendron molle]
MQHQLLEAHSEQHAPILDLRAQSHASQILGFKFQYYQHMEVNRHVSLGLYQLTALLVQEDFIDLFFFSGLSAVTISFQGVGEGSLPVGAIVVPAMVVEEGATGLGFEGKPFAINSLRSMLTSALNSLICCAAGPSVSVINRYPHLLPKDDEAFELYNSFSSKRLDEANKIGKINLAAIGKDLMEDEKQGDVTIDLFTAIDLESEAVTGGALELENNQTFGLLTGFLSVNDCSHDENCMFDNSHITFCWLKVFLGSLKSLSSTYELVRQTHLQNLVLPSAAVSDSMETNSYVKRFFVDLLKELSEMLSCAGPYLYCDTLLLQKSIERLLPFCTERVRCSDGSFDPESGFGVNGTPRLHQKEARLRIEEALGTCLLPSLQLTPANSAVGQEIWDVMNLLPYELDTRRILKRLVKELKQLGRMVAKLAHANPMTVLRTIVHQIEANRDMITPVVDAFKYLTQARYRLYGEWEKDDERIPMDLAARQIAKLDMRRILKRLVKELKQLGRMVAKLAHANPMTVLRTIVHQIEAYRDMITPVVDAFKYLTQQTIEFSVQLEYDILEYVVIERLAQVGREKLKDDGLNLCSNLLLHSGDTSVAIICRCKKYPSMELRGRFQYLVNQLKKGNGIELVLLQVFSDMLSYASVMCLPGPILNTLIFCDWNRNLFSKWQMSNKQTENMTEEQLDAMAGSDTLRYQATSFGIARNNKALIKSTNRLRDSLLPKEDPKIAIPLLLLIAQHRSVVVINGDAPYIKMVSEEFDRCHGTFLQFVDFLCSAVTPATANAQLIPPLNDLVHLYHLDPEVADLLDTVSAMLPSKAWNSLSLDLYATFWGLTLYDLYVPRSRYESEISRQHAALKAMEELSDNLSSAIAKRKKDKERIQESLDCITFELQKHEENVASVRRRLTHEKDKWLSSCPDTLKINMEFLQRCIFPRCTFSMPDAVSLNLQRTSRNN